VKRHLAEPHDVGAHTTGLTAFSAGHVDAQIVQSANDIAAVMALRFAELDMHMVEVLRAAALV